MKIILCGKGGCGKSTVATLLARAYEKHGNNVLVIDSDESNYGLHRQLGFELPEDFTHYFGGKKGAYRKFDDKGYLFECSHEHNGRMSEYLPYKRESCTAR
ncbi:MAG: P-loop NTPase [Mogibacterium sp.]|nr:P-loop NTPase [Mogibacterium sp.]